MKRFILPLFTLMFSCTSYFISDTDLPEDVKIVSEVILCMMVKSYALLETTEIIPHHHSVAGGSICGRNFLKNMELSWENMNYRMGRYYIVEMDDLLLIKIPSVIFLKVVIFPE
jgi:hypothetical protein